MVASLIGRMLKRLTRMALSRAAGTQNYAWLALAAGVALLRYARMPEPDRTVKIRRGETLMITATDSKTVLEADDA